MWQWFNKHHKWITIMVGVLVVIGLILLWQKNSGSTVVVGYSSTTLKARVSAILEQGTVTLGEKTQTYQVLSVELLEGQQAGQLYELQYGKYQLLSDDYQLRVGDKILVNLEDMGDGSYAVYFIDHVRTSALLILLLVFIITGIAMSGWKGVSSMISMALSILIMLAYIIPHIIAGQDPITVSLIGSFVFLALTQYLVFGWTLKTHIALGGITFAVLITGLISVLFVNWAHLNGAGDESAMYLVQMGNGLDIKKLLIAGIFIGTLGVMDDLVIGQTSAVIELYRGNPQMSFARRFRSAMQIGQDHVGATVNTLILAYLGATLSMIVLYTLNNVDLGVLVNINYIAEEIVRSLVGTIGLFLAVPFTTLLACWVVDDETRLSRLVHVFGPLINMGDAHASHHHER
ncbi:MAG: YibE/F family protein [Chloroflexi bacterium]|nr:YibE/F family protein [Chloroflexota bacterium]